jgi:hypothetical protein
MKMFTYERQEAAERTEASVFDNSANIRNGSVFRREFENVAQLSVDSRPVDQLREGGILTIAEWM